jgi:ribose transport system permease protein
MLAAWLTASHGSPLGIQFNTWLTLLIVLGFGALVGLVNAVLVVRFRINAFIVTLATYISVRGLGLILTGGRSMYSLPSDFRAAGSSDLLGLPLLNLDPGCHLRRLRRHSERTQFGRWVILIGGNPTAPFRAGIDVDGVLYRVFILSGVIAAFAGFLLAARTNGATPNSASACCSRCSPPVVIGGVSLRGGIGGLSGVFAGVLLLSTIDTAINVMGLDASYMQVIRGSLMLLAVLLDSVKQSIERKYG